MTLTQIRYLVALSDQLHFGRAAADCGVSQPTLSAQIKKLEAYLGAPLFDRSGSDVALTPLGAHIVEHARRMLDEADAIVGAARRGSEPMVGPRRLGVIPSLCPYFLPWALPSIQSAFPKLVLHCAEDLTERLVEDFRARRLDWAVIAAPFSAPGAETLPLFEEAFLAALPADHSLAQSESAPQASLAAEQLLLLGEGHCLRDQALALCSQVSPDAHLSGANATSLETLRGLVAGGLGLTLMPELAARPHDGVVYRPLSPAAGRQIVLLHRAAPPQRVEARLLAKEISKAYASRTQGKP